MKVWNLGVNRGADGSKHLDLQIHGVIDGGWMDDGQGVDSAEIVAELNKHLDAKTIGARINSIGGSAFGGVAVYNALQSHPADVKCTVEGLAASAASLIAMAGKCTMGRGAMMMVHPPLAMAMGNAADLRKTADFLDKVQSSISTIYTAKTGKSADEIKTLVDAETWMTADEAVAAGFADSISNEEPAAEDPKMVSDSVLWQGVKFPTSLLPQRIMNMAKEPVPPVPPVQQQPAAQPTLAIVPPPAPQPPITRAELALRSPELVTALLDEGKAAGVTAERARLQAIDELGLTGCDEIVAAAKYGDKPSDAPTLAMAAVKAGKLAGAELLAARRVESRAMAGINPTIPDTSANAEEARAVKTMVDAVNARRGGVK